MIELRTPVSTAATNALVLAGDLSLTLAAAADATTLALAAAATLVLGIATAADVTTLALALASAASAGALVWPVLDIGLPPLGVSSAKSIGTGRPLIRHYYAV